MSRRRRLSSLTAVALGVFLGPALAQPPLDKVPVQWDKVTRVSKTIPTLQVVVNPPLRRGSAIHDNAFKALRDLQADYVRYVPWLPYPKLGTRVMQWALAPEVQADGTVVGLIAVINDVTERHQIQQRLKRSEEETVRFKMMSDSAATSMWGGGASTFGVSG